MDYQTYGDPDGLPVFYFHGTPGAPAEAAWLAAAAQANGLRLLALERDSLDPCLQGEAYLAELTAAVSRLAGEHPVHLLGFSIGASLALRVAARLPKPAAGIWLVSAAAPLEWPDSWQGMGAGRYTFALAQNYPWLFRLLSTYQGWLARHFTGLLLRSLFQGARGADAQLLGQAPLREQLMNVQRQCFARGAGAYVRDVQCYVEPWARVWRRYVRPCSYGTAIKTTGRRSAWPTRCSPGLVRKPNCTGWRGARTTVACWTPRSRCANSWRLIIAIKAAVTT